MDVDPAQLLPGERVLWTRSAWCGWRAFLRGQHPLWAAGLALLVASELAGAVHDRLRGEALPWLGWRHVAEALLVAAVALEVVPRVLEQRGTLYVVTSRRLGAVEARRQAWLIDPAAPPIVTSLPGGRARCAWARRPVELHEPGRPARVEDQELTFVVPEVDLPGLRAALER